MNDRARLYHGDCLEVMPTLEPPFDMILCDLPYGQVSCSWDQIIPFEPLWKQYKRLIKPNGAIVLFGSQPFTSALVMSNPKWFRYEWIWDKSNGGGFLNANRQPLKRHENICIFSRASHSYYPQKTKGLKAYSCTSSSAGESTRDQSVAGWVTKNDGSRYPVSILKFANDTGQHPTQKPVDLLAYLIRTYTLPGELILDNTMGSGSTGVAAILNGRRFEGIEKERKYFEIAQKRIEQAQQEVDSMLIKPWEVEQASSTSEYEQCQLFG